MSTATLAKEQWTRTQLLLCAAQISCTGVLRRYLISRKEWPLIVLIFIFTDLPASAIISTQVLAGMFPALSNASLGIKCIGRMCISFALIGLIDVLFLPLRSRIAIPLHGYIRDKVLREKAAAPIYFEIAEKVEGQEQEKEMRRTKEKVWQQQSLVESLLRTAILLVAWLIANSINKKVISLVDPSIKGLLPYVIAIILVAFLGAFLTAAAARTLYTMIYARDLTRLDDNHSHKPCSFALSMKWCCRSLPSVSTCYLIFFGISVVGVFFFGFSDIEPDQKPSDYCYCKMTKGTD